MEASQKEKILVVDDEVSICTSIERYLSKEGFSVITTTTPADALRIAHTENIQVAIVDRLLDQETDGITIIAELKRLHPYCQTILISGQPSFESAAKTMRYQTFAYLSKPFKQESLRKIVCDAAEEYQKQKSQGIQQSLFTSLFEATPIPIILCDAQGYLVFVNPSFCQTFGYSAQEIIGKSLHEVIGISGGIFEQTIRKTLSGENLPEFNAIIHKKDGAFCDVAVTLSRCSNQSARFQGVWVILRDITMVKRLREEVLQTEKLSMLGSMTAKIVHQINNPVQVLIGYLELLRESSCVPAHMQKYLTTMHDAAHMIKRLTSEFLNLARPHPRVISTFPPEAPLEKAVDFLFQTGQINQCTILKEYDHNAPMVQGDFQQLNQAFINLLVNAVHAMEEQCEKILSVKTKGNINGTVTIEVQDNGCGIPPDIQDKIFEHFFTTRGNHGGTGLGLPLVKSIVEWHHGSICVESVPGKGATFIINLPCYSDELLAGQAA
ncbi:MAG: ATP-binding protein [Desulfobacterota bacterium]|nr:ATP-binding protein [Thermodesulfobacteriota bacterium]